MSKPWPHRLPDTLGGVDILFANAGIARFHPLSEFEESAFDDIMNTNVKGLFFTVQRIAPLMGRWGV